MTFTLTLTAPVPVGPATFFGNASLRALRETLRQEHQIGTGEAGFTGFASRTGFTTVTVTSASALVSALAAMTVNDKKIIKCRWNGVSDPTTTSVQGPANGSMVANAGVDWGYDRPAWSVIIEPDTGYTPIFGATGGTSLNLDGTHWHEFNDMTFTGGVWFGRTPGYRNGLPIAAMKRCTFQGPLDGRPMRTMHLEDCSTTGALSMQTVQAEYYRVWNLKSGQLSPDVDFSHNFGFSDPACTNWIAHTWLAGVTLVQMAAGTGNGNHFDWWQFMINGDLVAGYHAIVEFCTINANAPDTQIMWKADVVAGKANSKIIHNNIFANVAYWGGVLSDPSGTQLNGFHRNLLLRGGIGPDVEDTFPRVGILANNVSAGGSYIVSENYMYKEAGTETSNSNVTAPVTVSGNIHVDPRLGASVGNRMEDLFTGNGTWGTNGAGFKSYTSPDIAAGSVDAGRAAFIAFVTPKVGWRAAGAGPVDPATWPTSYNQALT